MPEPALDTRHEAMKFVGASLEGDPIHFNPNGGAPSRHGGAPSRYASDSDDSGKDVAVEGDTDVSGFTGKELMNVASSSSSSSSTVAETPDEGDPIYLNPNGGAPSQYASDSGDSDKDVVVEGDTDVSGFTGKELMNVASSSSSSTVAENNDMSNNLASGSSSQHDEAEDRNNFVPEALPMLMRSLAITPMSESDAVLHSRNRDPILFEDSPEQANISSGLGNYEIMRLMELAEEPQHDADPQQVQEPEEIAMLSTAIVTFQVPGFAMGQGGGIVPFAEEQSVEDPDHVGLENLNIFLSP